MSFLDSPTKCRFAIRLLCLAQAGVFVLASGASFADDPTGYIHTEGMDVYYAVLPAELIREYPKGSPEFIMHGGPPAGNHQHHVMVALFEGKALKRITDAKVTANVAETGLAGKVKQLEPMLIADALAFGNYFYFSNLATYRVTIKIRRGGSARAVEVSFKYKHQYQHH
jgi:hypothetical protein